jgi:Zn-dependent protease with chaperone function
MTFRFLRELKSQVLLGFRMRWYFYIASVAAATTLWFMPYTGVRISSAETSFFVTAFALPLFGGFIAAGRFFGTVIDSNLKIVLYDRSHKPEESLDPDLKALAASKGVDYCNPIKLTDNPDIDSPYTNAVKQQVTFPKSWLSHYSREQFLGAGMHEIGHIKFRRKYFKEILTAGILTAGFSLFLGLRLGWAIVLIAEVTFLVLAFTIVSHRNELRCDRLAAETMGKEAVISLLEDLGRRYGFDSGSETHPPIRYRIEMLKQLP